MSVDGVGVPPGVAGRADGPRGAEARGGGGLATEERSVDELLAWIQEGEDHPCRVEECPRVWDDEAQVLEHLYRWHEPEDEERRRRVVEQRKDPAPEGAGQIDGFQAWPGPHATSDEEENPEGPDQDAAEGSAGEEVEMAEKFPCKDCPDREPFDTQKGLRRHRTVVHGDAPARPAKPRSGGRKRRGGRKTAAGRPARKGTRQLAGSSDGQLEHRELVLMEGILKSMAELTPEGRKWLVRILTEAVGA